MRKILTYLTFASLALVGYTSNVCTPCSQNSVAENCPTSTHLCCMNAAGNGGCCASMGEGCDGNGIFYGEFFAPFKPEIEEAQPTETDVVEDEPMWIGRIENYRPPRPQKDIENVFKHEEEPVEDAPMWIGRKENYRPPRPQEDIEDMFDKSPKYDEKSEESEFKAPPPHGEHKWGKHGNRPPPPPIVRKARRFAMEHRQELTIASIVLIVAFLYRRYFMTPVSAPKEEAKCTCTCKGQQQQNVPVVAAPTMSYTLWNPPQQPLVEKPAHQLV